MALIGVGSLQSEGTRKTAASGAGAATPLGEGRRAIYYGAIVE